jgi:CHAD domain-containing protein
MAKKIKWLIKELRYSKQLHKSANVILKSRIESLIYAVEKYTQSKTAENLHDVRIALRRVRYSMELFYVCFNKKDFMRFYNKIQNLQDLSGFTRDIDITLENVYSVFGENAVPLNDAFTNKISEKKIFLEEQFNKELQKFINGKSFKDFYKQNY